VPVLAGALQTQGARRRCRRLRVLPGWLPVVAVRAAVVALRWGSLPSSAFATDYGGEAMKPAALAAVGGCLSVVGAVVLGRGSCCRAGAAGGDRGSTLSDARRVSR
jgi:hypothetical protein